MPARKMPQNLEAEMSVLGVAFLNKNALTKICEELYSEMFYSEANQKLFEAIKTCYDEKIPVDITTVKEVLDRKKNLNAVGGIEYISDVIDSVATAANLDYYIKIVKDKAVMRNLIETATDIVTNAYEEDEDITHMLDEAEKKILNVVKERQTSDFIHIKDAIATAQENLERLSQNKSDITGLPTGFYDLDKASSGLHAGEMIIIAARPGMGKTAFALNVAYNVSYKSDEAVAIFSLEMPAEQLIQRIICSAGSLKAESLRSGSILKESSERYYAAADKVSKCNLYIDDTPGIRVGEIAAKCRRLKREQGLKMIVIDYLQLISGPANSRESRQQEVSDISRQLKMIARELEVPVLALSQLSRSVEKRDNKRPVLSDLRESGAIEQDADIVSFIHREDYQDPKKEAETQGATDIIIAKHRNGALADIRLVFLKQFSKFANPARADQQINPLEGVKDLRT